MELLVSLAALRGHILQLIEEEETPTLSTLIYLAKVEGAAVGAEED
jgi:hypothetical protein